MSVLVFLLVLVVLIVVHEFGHFIVAKSSGMRVDEFGVGFPPRAWGKKIGETLYSVNILPFGGFVRIFGEDKESTDPQDPDIKRAFFNKPRYSQALVLVAGVVMNVLLAWVIFIGISMYGVSAPETPENKAKLTGVEFSVLSVLSDSPAQKAGLKPGDTILAAESGGERVPLSDGNALNQYTAKRGEAPFTLIFEREGEELTRKISATTGIIEGAPERPALGVSVARMGTLKLPFFEAIAHASRETGELLILVTIGLSSFLWSALTLSADLSQVAGPVGIAVLTGEAASLGIVTLLQFTAFISLNLAIINLIPFPALDGGRLAFLGIETLTGKQVPPRVMQMTNLVGFSLLILLMLAVTYGDIIRLTG